MKLLAKITLTFFSLLVALWFVVVQPIVPPEKVKPAKRASAESLRRYVTKLASVLPPRSHDSDKLNVSAAYIKKVLTAYPGARVTEQPYDVWGIPYKNILASFGPVDGPRMIVGAHYDSHDGLPGADDNASGVAALLELASMLDGEALSMRVDLVAYALEEMPSFRTPDMGSAHHAARLKEAGVDVELMISLEMIGYFDDRPDSQSYPLSLLYSFYPDRGNYIAVVGNLAQIGPVRRVKQALLAASNIAVESINAPALIPGIDFSDHLNFWHHGYPAVMITDTADYRNVAYHTVRDTPERLDYRRMAQVVDGIYALLSGKN